MIIVICYTYDDSWPIGVFSTIERAKQACINFNGKEFPITWHEKNKYQPSHYCGSGKYEYTFYENCELDTVVDIRDYDD